jgi:hypothetical protein
MGNSSIMHDSYFVSFYECYFGKQKVSRPTWVPHTFMPMNVWHWWFIFNLILCKIFSTLLQIDWVFAAACVGKHWSAHLNCIDNWKVWINVNRSHVRSILYFIGVSPQVSVVDYSLSHNSWPLRVKLHFEMSWLPSQLTCSGAKWLNVNHWQTCMELCYVCWSSLWACYDCWVVWLNVYS